MHGLYLKPMEIHCIVDTVSTGWKIEGWFVCLAQLVALAAHLTETNKEGWNVFLNTGNINKKRARLNITYGFRVNIFWSDEEENLSRVMHFCIRTFVVKSFEALSILQDETYEHSTGSCWCVRTSNKMYCIPHRKNIYCRICSFIVFFPKKNETDHAI